MSLSLIAFVAWIACDGAVDDDKDDTQETDDTDVPETDVPRETDVPPDTDVPVETDVPPDSDVPEDTDVPFPNCRRGTSFVTWTRDEGATLAPLANGPDVNTYTFGVAILPDDPNVLWGEHGGTLWRSDDGGCTWSDHGALPDVWWNLIPRPNGLVWGYRENGGWVMRIDGTTVETTPFPGSALGLGVDPNDPTHIRVGGSDGVMYDKVGAGRWTSAGGPGGIAYSWAFDPSDLDRAVVGRLGDGAAITDDGGLTFDAVLGFGPRTNVFTVVFSPADPNVVWAEGLDMDEADAQAPSQGRHLWRSDDGGRSFSVVVDQGGEVTLTNGVPIAPHPTDPNVVYFAFGTSFQGGGSWLYRYDHAAPGVTWTHTAVWHEYRAIAVSPVDPALIYLAVVHERIR